MPGWRTVLAAGTLTTIVALPAATPAPAAPTVSAVELPKTLTQTNVARKGYLTARIRVRTRMRAVVQVRTAETTGGKPGPVRPVGKTRKLRFVPGRSRAVRVTLNATGRRLVGRCAARTITVGFAGRRFPHSPATPLTMDSAGCQRFFSLDGVWNKPLADSAALDPHSADIVKTLLTQVNDEKAKKYGPYLNYQKFSTPVYVVPEDQRRVRVVLDDNAQYRKTLAEAFKSVPLPSGAKPADGGDEHLAIWQPATDTMWEFHHFQWRDGVPHAKMGGVMPDVSRNPGYFDGPNGAPWGATATSLPLAGGLIRRSDLEAPSINHALSLSIRYPRATYWSFPAQRTDGSNTATYAVPLGARFRLPPSLDIASLHLPPLTEKLAYAAQRYGIILRDTAGTTTFYGEDPRTAGADVWTGALGGALSTQPMMAAFPWERLELLKLDLRTYNHGKSTTPPKPGAGSPPPPSPPPSPPPVCLTPPIC